MQAAQLKEFGGKDALETVSDADKPTLEPGQVLVEVHAAAVNPFDWKVREGLISKDLELPAILGGDLAGVVSEVGEGVNGFTVGGEVYGQANALSGHGSYAEFAPVSAESIGPKPASVDFVTAAALPLAGVSAIQALVEHAELKPEQKVLIHGGGGGIGTFAIQLAKHIGAYVATTAQASDTELVKGLGADKIIDYETQDFTDIIKDYDVVYDLVGGETFTKSYQVLKPGGVIVSMTAQADEALNEKYQVRAVSQFTRVTTARLAALTELIETGAIKAQIDKTFPLEQAAEALEYIKTGQHQGKVVLKVM